MREIILGSKKINEDSEPYIIAEIGVNHEGSISKAKHLIDLCASAGAHAAKFQTYKADTLASIDSPAYWDLNQESSKNQHELFKKYACLISDYYSHLSDETHKDSLYNKPILLAQSSAERFFFKYIKYESPIPNPATKRDKAMAV